MKAIIPGIISAVISGIVAMAAAFLIPTGSAPSTPSPDEEHSEKADSHGKDQKKKKDDKGKKDKHAKKDDKKKKKGDKKKGGDHGKDKGDYADFDPDGVVFVNLDPMIVSLGPRAKSKYLKITLTLQTTGAYEGSLNELRPRFRDVLNTYLRAVDEDDLADPMAMTRLRAQLLRRIRIVADEDVIDDILITEFVLT